MNTTQSITDAQGNDQKPSLRGEAPQVQGVKGKGKETRSYLADTPSTPPQPTKQDTTATAPKNSPFVTVDYQEQQEARKDRLEQHADNARQESQAVYKRAKDMASVIPFGQPILVGHHSEHRDRRYRDRIHNTFGKAFSLDDKARHYDRKATHVGAGGIASNDPEAITKLNKKLTSLIEAQETMKAANRALKKGNDPALVELGFDDAMIGQIKKPDFGGRTGFASYQLQNNNAEIRRTQQRIKELEALRNSEPLAFCCEDFSLSVDNGRLVIDFPNGKPSEPVRSLVKGAGFKWSRYQTAWVRKATANAVASAKYLLPRLEEIKNIYGN
ncbi:MAG: DUF3560 domain-containing protein [Pseudomonadales bacterium]